MRNRILFLLCAIVLVTSASGMALIWYTYRIDARLTRMIDKNIGAYQAAQKLETALVNQKGFVSYYLLDSDPDWLGQLGIYRQIFKEQLRASRALAETPPQLEAIGRIAGEYTRYIGVKDRVIAHYQLGELKTGAELHPEARKLFFNILDLCEKYKESHWERIQEVKGISRAQARKLRMLAAAAVGFDFVLGILLAVLVTQHILTPVRQLTREAKRPNDPYRPQNEIDALAHSVRGLIDDVDESQSELTKSREHLLQAEKMA
ncbi:MAG: histidine kinase, partial [Desulfobacterales bacterium]